jgi:DNA gyrase/topoisomerase IV subunit B
VEDEEEDFEENSDLSDSDDCSSDEEDSCAGKRKRGNQDRKSKAIVEVHGMKINIETITDQEMYSLRKVLPRKDYR